jgi:small-conductance mechanosensitive channel
MLENDRKLFGKVLFFVGTFILAETIIRFFLNLANDSKIAFWVLPLMALLLVIDGFQLENKIKEKWVLSWITDFFIIIEIILVVFLFTGYLSPELFLLISLIGVIVIIVSWILEWVIRKK